MTGSKAKYMRRYVKAVCVRVTADIREYGLAIAVLILYTIITNLIFHAFCPLIIFCGIPCPGCGVSRATAYFLMGRWQQAWMMNPMIFPIAITAVYFGWNRYLIGRKAAGIKVIIIVLVVLLVVVYGVRMYLYYPNRIPYVYTEDNMLERMLSFYRQIIYSTGR